MSETATPPPTPETDPPIRIEVLLQKPDAKDPSRVAAWAAFLRHPALLLVAGFVLTTLLGTSVTEAWKAEEWRNQQRYLWEQRRLESSYELVSSIMESVAETLVAADDLATVGYWDWDREARKEELAEREQRWSTSSREWRAEAEKFSFEIAATFGDATADESFVRIRNKRRQLGVKARNLLEEIGPQGPGMSPRAKELAREINDLSNAVRAEMGRLGTILGRHLAAPAKAVSPALGTPGDENLSKLDAVPGAF